MKKTRPSFIFEKELWNDKYMVIGIDEVGRGPLAGPVYVGAVCFDSSIAQQEARLCELGIMDSKLTTEKKRKELVPIIQDISLCYSVTSSDVEIINTKGIVYAIHQAIRNAVHTITKKINKRPFLLLDAFTIPGCDEIPLRNQKGIIHGDMLSLSIAAASILAKVERDEEMERLHTTHPAYGWSQNKGYGTVAHRQAIQTFGITRYHRSLYVRNVLGITQ